MVYTVCIWATCRKVHSNDISPLVNMNLNSKHIHLVIELGMSIYCIVRINIFKDYL